MTKQTIKNLEFYINGEYRTGKDKKHTNVSTVNQWMHPEGKLYVEGEGYYKPTDLLAEAQFARGRL